MHEYFPDASIEYFKTLLHKDVSKERVFVKNQDAERFLDDVIRMQSNGWFVEGGVGRSTTTTQSGTSKEYFAVMFRGKQYDCSRLD